MRIPRRRVFTVLVSLAMTVALLPSAGVVAKQPLPNYRPVAAPSWVTNPTPDFSHLDTTVPAGSAGQASEGAGGSPTYSEGDSVIGLSLNNVSGSYFATYFTVRAIGEHIEVWVQQNPNFPTDDPRNPVEVTDEEIAYLVNEFDTNIYPKESEFWREPAHRDGTNAILDDIFGLDPDAYVSSDGQDRVIAMISNVRDDAFYDPTFPVYIAGFFSSTINAYLDRNVITIDAYDWANRVGPNDSPWRDSDPNNDRPHLYEGTFAHEYQHLLHADQNPGEESWVNEGLSDWTEWLVGYGIPDGHWDTAQEYAENSLVIWGDQGQSTEILADYGEAFMFMHYLYGKYGEAGMKALFQDQGFGIAGFNDALANIGANDSFADMYHDFAIARLVLANNGDYQLRDIPSPVVLNEEAYSTPGAPPWGSDYLTIEHPKKVSSIAFDGVDMITRNTGWTVADDPIATDTPGAVLYSGAANEMDRFAIFETTGGGTLSFDTIYDIENEWDFGFVQVSTDNGVTWTTLTNADTTSIIDPNGYPAIKDQLGAGFTGISGTGLEPEWVNETFDLSAYAGQSILVGFRMMTDWGSLGNGFLEGPNWYIDNVMVDSTLISDGTDASAFSDITAYQPIAVDFTVDLVSLPRVGSIGNSSYKVLHLITDDASEMASADQIREALRNSNLLVLIVTYDAPQGVADYADYTLDVQYR